MTSCDVLTLYSNGNWYDGEGFEPRPSVQVCDGTIVAAGESDSPSETIDLAGAYVIPPLGDAHTHQFDSGFAFEAQNSAALRAGIFYGMTMTAPTSSSLRVRPRFEETGTVDVQTALGGMTGPDSHPAEVYEALALGFYSYQQQLDNAETIQASSRVADDAYYVLRTENEVREKWPFIMSRGPDFIKVFLRSSERFEEGWGKWGPGGGIDPKLLPLIRDLADESGKRLAVAASSVADVEAAADVRADIITHLPCYQDTTEPGPYQDFPVDDECLISAELAGELAAAGSVTVLIATEWPKDRGDDFVAWEQANIATLKAAGADFAIGSNAYGANLVDGLIAAEEKGLFSAGDLLRWVSQSSPQLIFPDRPVGCLTEGCEASFLVLEADPLEKLDALRNIRLRVKEGLLLDFPVPQQP